MKPSVGVVCLLAAAVLYYLTAVDRQSVVALHVVELQGKIPISMHGALAAAGVLVIALALLKRLMRQPERITAGPVRRDPVGHVGHLGKMPLRARVETMAANLVLPEGCRLLVDERVGVPLTLFLDGVPSGRGRRAIETLAGMVALLPTPPRLAVVYRHCPPSTGPRQTEVQGALASRIPRGNFRVTSHVDRVDVVFLQPDPQWVAEW